MPNDWSDWKQHVLNELSELKDEVRAGREDIAKFQVELAILKLKSGLWGFAAGALPTIGMLIIWSIKDSLFSS